MKNKTHCILAAVYNLIFVLLVLMFSKWETKNKMAIENFVLIK